MFSAKTLVLLLVLLLPTANGQAADNKTSTVSPKTKLSSDDTTFVKDAAQGGLMVQLGKLAQEKAGNEKGKEFGKRMEQDHSKANEELKKIASDKDVQLSNELDKKHKGKVDKLTKRSGADFDKQYMDAMVSDDKEDIKKFQRADKGKDAELKQFARQTLPTLKEHLQLAESTVQQVKSASKSSKTPNR